MKKIALLLALAALVGAASAQVVGYSNLGTSQGPYLNGGATTASPLTALVADDITFASGTAGGAVTAFSWSVYNYDTTAFSARSRVRFYAADGASGGPGTYLNGFSFTPSNLAAKTIYSFSYTSATSIFTVPTNRKIWAGITFDNVGGTATVANLNNLGQSIVNNFTAGSSADVFFTTNTTNSGLSSNPSGGFYYFGGSPAANFAWSFTVNPTPEPSALAALGVGALALLRRRKRV